MAAGHFHEAHLEVVALVDHLAQSQTNALTKPLAMKTLNHQPTLKKKMMMKTLFLT
jgi:hypothetical protein